MRQWADRNRTRAEIADVEAATQSRRYLFDAIYHNAVIRAERDQDYFKAKPGLALTFRSVANETHRDWSDPYSQYDRCLPRG
jgi:hypothetical protein